MDRTLQIYKGQRSYKWLQLGKAFIQEHVRVSYISIQGPMMKQIWNLLVVDVLLPEPLRQCWYSKGPSQSWPSLRSPPSSPSHLWHRWGTSPPGHRSSSTAARDWSLLGLALHKKMRTSCQATLQFKGIAWNCVSFCFNISFMLREVAALRPSKWDQTPTARVLLLYPSANILGGHWNQWRMRTIGLLDVEPICWTNQLKIVWTCLNQLQ